MKNTLTATIIASVVAIVASFAIFGYLGRMTVPAGATLPNATVFDNLTARQGLNVGYAGNQYSSGQVQVQAQRVTSLTSTTTSLCVIANPTGATSSIVHASMNITTATSSALTVVVGTTTNQYATSSSMVTSAVIAANAQGTVSWDGGVNNDVIGPSQSVVFGVGAGSSVSYAYTLGGTCEAVFETDN